MRIFSIILADDEQQILYGMKKGIEWEKLGFRVAGVQSYNYSTKGSVNYCEFHIAGGKRVL